MEKIITILYKAKPFIYEIGNKHYFIDGNKSCECKEKELENYEKLMEIYEEYRDMIGEEALREKIKSEDIKKFDIIDYYNNIITMKIEDMTNKYIETTKLLMKKDRKIFDSIIAQNEIRIQILKIVDEARLKLLNGYSI